MLTGDVPNRTRPDPRGHAHARAHRRLLVPRIASAVRGGRGMAGSAGLLASSRAQATLLRSIESQVGDGSARIVFPSSGFRVFAPSRDTLDLAPSREGREASCDDPRPLHFTSAHKELTKNVELGWLRRTSPRARAATLAQAGPDP
jgi:hypothetical protein